MVMPSTRNEIVALQALWPNLEAIGVSWPASFIEVDADICPRSCNQFNNTSSLLDLLLSFLAEVSCSHNEWDLWYSALAEDFGVAEREEVEDRCGITLLRCEVCCAGLHGD